MPSKCPHHSYESGWTAKLGHDFPKSIIMNNCVGSFGEVDKRHVYIDILVVEIRLKLICCERHIYFLSVVSEFTLTFWEKDAFNQEGHQATQHTFASVFPALDKRIGLGNKQLSHPIARHGLNLLGTSLTYWKVAPRTT